MGSSRGWSWIFSWCSGGGRLVLRAVGVTSSRCLLPVVLVGVVGDSRRVFEGVCLAGGMTMVTGFFCA